MAPPVFMCHKPIDITLSWESKGGSKLDDRVVPVYLDLRALRGQKNATTANLTNPTEGEQPRVDNHSQSG